MKKAYLYGPWDGFFMFLIVFPWCFHIGGFLLKEGNSSE